MTVVYVESVLLLNTVVNYLLLSASGRLCGEFPRRVRCCGAAGLGAVYGVATLLPQGGIFGHPIFQAGVGVLMLLMAFGHSGRLIRIGALFLVLSCAFGGSVLLLEYAGWDRGGPPLQMRTLLIVAALSYGLLSILLNRQFIHSRAEGDLVEITIFRGENSVTMLALLDSGNTLRDPLTGRSVCIAEGERVFPLLPEVPNINRAQLANPIELLKQAQSHGVCLQLLPYRAVGIDSGLLAALWVDKVKIGERVWKHCLLALSPTPVSDGGGYGALLGAEGRDGL